MSILLAGCTAFITDEFLRTAFSPTEKIIILDEQSLVQVSRGLCECYHERMNGRRIQSLFALYSIQQVYYFSWEVAGATPGEENNNLNQLIWLLESAVHNPVERFVCLEGCDALPGLSGGLLQASQLRRQTVEHYLGKVSVELCQVPLWVINEKKNQFLAQSGVSSLQLTTVSALAHWLRKGASGSLPSEHTNRLSAQALPTLAPVSRSKRILHLFFPTGKDPVFPAIGLLELVILVALAELLIRLSVVDSHFMSIDLRLFLIVVMSYLYGSGIGLTSAVVECGMAAYAATTTGISLNVLFYDPSNWFIFGLYLFCGCIFGCISDRSRHQLQLERQEKALEQESYQFLHHLYQSVLEEKNQFKGQLIGSRSAFDTVRRTSAQMETLNAHSSWDDLCAIASDTLGTTYLAFYTREKDSSFHRVACGALFHGADILSTHDTAVTALYQVNCAYRPVRICTNGTPETYAVGYQREGVLCAVLLVQREEDELDQTLMQVFAALTNPYVLQMEDKK